MTPIAWLIAGTFCLRLVLGWAVGLGIDESYMVAAGRVMQLGYFDHPPLAWWLSAGIAHLTGSEAAWVVRLPFEALFAVSTWLMFRFTAEMFSAPAGWWAALAFNLAPVFGLTTGGWVLPDGPLVCALLGGALCLSRALDGRGAGWWGAAGLCAGVALLSKYSAVLVLGGAVVGLATVPAYRAWLRRPAPYLAALLALMAFAPVLLWNAEHGWVSFAFQGSRAAASRWQPFGPLVVLAGAAGFLLPWLWLGLAVELWRGLRAGPAVAKTWLLCWMALVPIALFTLVAFWSRNVLFHWAMPGYLFLFPLLGRRVAGWRPDTALRWVTGSAAVLGCVLGLAVGEVWFNWLAVFRPGFDPGLQAVDLTGLRSELAARDLLALPLAAPSWNEAGKIGYALGPATPVLCLNTDARQFGFLPGPATHLGEDVLIVTLRPQVGRIESAYAANFERIEPIAPALVPVEGRGRLAVLLFIGHKLRHWP